MVAKSGSMGFAEIGASILKRLELTNQLRDSALHDGRQIVRLSANTVRAIHRGELAEADQLLAEARAMLRSMLDGLGPSSNLRSAGYVQDAMKECAEAAITLAIVAGTPIPTPADLDIDDAPYLNALAESASELRRRTLDQLRSGDFSGAEQSLEIMDEVYAFLVTVDFPDGLTGGLRRSTDALRAVLERTRADLTITGAQNRLYDAIQQASMLRND